MSAPLDFLGIFAGKLREAGIRFAITSGMACVHYRHLAVTKVASLAAATESELVQVLPLVDEMLP